MQNDTLVGAIEAADEARYRAMIAGDIHGLAALLDDDLVYTHSSGATDTKASWLAAIRSGHVRYRSATREATTVRLIGGVAVLHGLVRLEVDVAGTPYALRSAFMSAWTNGDGQWKLAHWHSTPLLHGG